MTLVLFLKPKMIDLAKGKRVTVHEKMTDKSSSMPYVLETARIAREGNKQHLQNPVKRLVGPESSLLLLLDDKSPNVAIVVAEALYLIGKKEKSMETLKRFLTHDDLFVRAHVLSVFKALDMDLSLIPMDLETLLLGREPTDRSYDVRAARYPLRKIKGNKVGTTHVLLQN